MENAGVCQGAIAFFAVSPLFACFACFFFYFTCLFVCFFYLRVLLDRMLCLEPDWNIFLTSLFFFTFESHWCGQCCGSYNTCSWNVRPFFLHVFVDNQSKRRLFKF